MSLAEAPHSTDQKESQPSPTGLVKFGDCDGFLRELRQLADSDGGLLIGVDLHKPTSRLEAAYNDAAGDDVDPAPAAAGGQPDDLNCASCHSAGGVAGSIEGSHRIAFEEAREAFEAEILAVDNTAPGDSATVTYKVSNPLTGEDYDLSSDPAFASDGVDGHRYIAV